MMATSTFPAIVLLPPVTDTNTHTHAATTKSTPWYQLASPADAPAGSTRIPFRTADGSIEVTFVEQQRSQLLGAVIWEGGATLAHYLPFFCHAQKPRTATSLQLPSSIHSTSDGSHLAVDSEVNGADAFNPLDLPLPLITPTTRIVELGSGVGIVGLVASKLHPHLVVLTDLQQVLPVLEESVQATYSAYDLQQHSVTVTSPSSQSSSTIHVCECEWQSEIQRHQLPPLLQSEWDLVLLADVIYDGFQVDEYGINNYARLYATLLALCTPNTVVLLQYTARREEEQAFFALMKQTFVWTSISARDAMRLAMQQRHCSTHSWQDIDERMSFYAFRRTSLAGTQAVAQGATTRLLRHLEAEQQLNDNALQDKIASKLADSLASVSVQQFEDSLSPRTTKCELCEELVATIWCEQCEDTQSLCKTCDRQLHMPAKFATHQRCKLRDAPRLPSTYVGNASGSMQD